MTEPDGRDDTQDPDAENDGQAQPDSPDNNSHEGTGKIGTRFYPNDVPPTGEDL